MAGSVEGESLFVSRFDRFGGNGFVMDFLTRVLSL